MITVNDVINENELDIIVDIDGKNPNDDCDPLSENYYHGALGDIPEIYRKCEVLRTGWKIGKRCHSIAIPFMSTNYND